jgi:hypothetical protein
MFNGSSQSCLALEQRFGVPVQSAQSFCALNEHTCLFVIRVHVNPHILRIDKVRTLYATSQEGGSQVGGPKFKVVQSRGNFKALDQVNRKILGRFR